MKNFYDQMFIWLGLIVIVLAGVVAHNVSKWAFLLILGLYVVMCVFSTERSDNRPVGFFVAAVATLIVMVLLKFNLHYAFMCIPTGMLLGYALASDKDDLSSVHTWLMSFVWFVFLFGTSCLMYFLV